MFDMNEKNNDAFENIIFPPKAQEPYPCVLEFCDMLKKEGINRVCDLGCGSGRHAIPMAKMGLTVIALDMSRKALSFVEEVACEENLNIETLYCNLPKIPLASSSIDAIVSTNVIHHAKLKAINETISEMHRVLAPGGYVLVTVFSKNDYRNNTGEQIETNTFYNTIGAEKNTIHHFFDNDSFVEAFNKFEIVDVPKEIISLSMYTDSNGNIFRGTLFKGIFKKMSINKNEEECLEKCLSKDSKIFS